MERLWLVIAVFAFFVICAGLMWLGYRNRRVRQAAVLPEFPSVPPDLGTEELKPLTGTYVCTTTTESWQDRVAIGDIGFRAKAAMHLHSGGVLIRRSGASALWLPRAGIEHARTSRGLAGKVMGSESLLVLRWTTGGSTFDSGFLADEVESYPEWISALGAANSGATAGGVPCEAFGARVSRPQRYCGTPAPEGSAPHNTGGQ